MAITDIDSPLGIGMALLAEEPMKGRPMEQPGIQTGSCTFEKADTRIGGPEYGREQGVIPTSKKQEN